jgi:hypothetical protein
VAATDRDQAEIQRRAALVVRAHEALHYAFAQRDDPASGGAEAWRDAAAALRDAVGGLYSPTLSEAVDGLKAGDPRAVEPAIVFLEADPWCFRSGYLKERLARYLPRNVLTIQQRERLEVVLVNAVDAGDRREFKQYCKLARRVATSRLQRPLRSRLHEGDPDVARRALLMLAALRSPRFTDADTTVARTIILRAANRPEEPSWWWLPDWSVRLATRFWSDDWAQELLMSGLQDGTESAPALRVLAKRPGPLPIDDAQKRELGELVLTVVDNGRDETWFEGAAIVADTPELRRSLAQSLERATQDGVRRRAFWALNAIRRSG